MKHSILQRAAAIILCTSLLYVDASAAIKEVALWGARSINDMGRSDRLITMDELKEDYSGYLQTDGMTEFFHKDSTPSPKTDMTEALAWLIDNGIINRDETITVSNITNIPSVSIVKSDINSKLFNNVNRSDALMYIYKSVFGPITGRTVGVETPSVRSDQGVPTLFSEMFSKYAEPDEQEINGVSTVNPGLNGSSGAGVGGSGGAGGDADVDTEYTNDAVKWRYTPQGDEYTSIFGDTNVFISENTFNQEATGGDGGDGGDGVYSGSFNSGAGGDGGNGGDGDNVINYETDYKQIYFVPGSDILFYRTDDVVESYLQAIMSRGLLNSEDILRTTKFETTFMPLTEDNAPLAYWSGDADPYVVNLSKATHVRVENVQSIRTADVLGSNYSVRNNGSALTITRNNLFESNTGYFTTEIVSRMEVYRYIYEMVYANEKKLSDLERDIVNYKYGMEFDGIASKEDINVLKYLIAKGILDYNGSNELVDLYNPVSWYDFIPVLYRVANHNARLDFSMVQLTDSEQSWKAMGFRPQTVQLTEPGAVGDIRIKYNEGYLSGLEPQDTSMFSKITEMLGITVVEAAPVEVGTLVYQVENGGTVTFSGYFFDFTGATFADSSALLASLRIALADLDKASREDYIQQVSDGFDASNPKHQIVGYMLKNMYVIPLIRTDAVLYTQLKDAIMSWKNSRPATMSEEIYQLKVMVAGYFLNMVESARTGEGAPSDITFNMVDGTRTNVPVAGATTFATNLQSIIFSMPQPGTGERKEYKYEFVEGSAGKYIAQGVDVVEAVNKSAVEFTRTITQTEIQVTPDPIELKLDFTQYLGTTLTKPMLFGIDELLAAGEPAFKQQVDPTGQDAFVSWKSIEQAMASSNGLVPLVKVSDGVLYNTETDTYAYFSPVNQGAGAVALVGTAIVTGDSELGVMFKTGDGEAAQLYYHVEAIRLLLNAGQENAILSGVRSMSLPRGNLEEAVSTIDLVSESGVSESKISGVRALISRDYSEDAPNFGDGTAFGQSLHVGKTVWGDFLSLTQANRVMNIVTRRIRFKSTSGQDNCTAYIVLRFIPVDAEQLGTVTITPESSLQDLLDAPAQPPSDPTANKVWTQNKAECNAYANWVYGTSNQTYIETGYVRPVATMYILGDVKDSLPPASLFSPLSASQIASVSIVSMGKVLAGAAVSLDVSPSDKMADDVNNKCAYWLAADCSAVVSCDRLYLHASMFTNLSISRGADKVMYARISNLAAKQAVFTPGSTFKVAGVPDVLSNGMQQPDIMVIGTSNDGTVTCQVGPIIGTPVSLGTTKAVVNATGNPDAVKTFSGYNLTYSNGDNRILSTFSEMFKSVVGVKNLGIMSEPIFTTPKSSQYYVFTGTHLKVYGQSSKPLGTVPIPSAQGTDTMATYHAAIKNAVSQYSNAHPNLTYTYLKISFPASKFRVRDGKLEYKPSSATEFLSPSLFSSINDLIIDEMLSEANGAIPINEIPAGSLLKLGNCYYQAMGTSTEDKSFVGYAYLNSLVSNATLQDTADAFGSHLIRAGNQYMNISHWFAGGTQVLGTVEDDVLAALTSVADQTLKLDGTAKRSVDANGNVEVIVSSSNGVSGSLYAPMKIVFTPGLLAYKVSAPGDTGSAKYQVCTSAENAVSGLFSTLPFFTDRVLDAEIYDATTGLLSATFNRYEGADTVMAYLQSQFQKAFAGDVVTLLRMLLFIVLCWLVIASWICYVLRAANLLPFLEALRYPGSNSRTKGIDLMKIVSLGTINLDTEFRLGKFLQYEAILACLLCVVMLTGNISV